MAKAKKLPAKLTPGTRSYMREVEQVARGLGWELTHSQYGTTTPLGQYPAEMQREIVAKAIAQKKQSVEWYTKALSDAGEELKNLEALNGKMRGQMHGVVHPDQHQPDLDVMLKGIDAELSGLCERQRALKQQRRDLVGGPELPGDHTRGERAAHAARMRWSRPR